MNLGSALSQTFRNVFSKGSSEPGGNDLEKTTQAKLTTLWGYVKNQYTSYHQSALIGFLMYAGQLWIRWDMNRKMYVLDVPDDDYVPTPQINRFSPAIDAICSNFNSVPSIQVTARVEDDSEAHEIADVANDLCQFFIEDTGLKDDFELDDDKNGLAAQFFTLAGNVFTEIWVDKNQVGQTPQMEDQQAYGCSCPNCGYYEVLDQPPPQTPLPCPQCGQAGIFDVVTVSQLVPRLDETSGQPLFNPIWKYRLRCRIVDPLSVYPRPGAIGMSNTPFFIQAERMALDEVRQRLGTDIDIQPDSEMPDGWSVQLEQQLQYYYQGFMSGVPQQQDAAMIIRFIVLPPGMNNPGMIEFPQGVDAWYSNGKLLKVTPFTDPQHPFSHARYQRIPKLFFGRAVAFDIANIQREINGYESLVKLHGQSASCEPIAYDENTVIEGSITNRGDKVIKFRSNGPGTIPPFRLQHENLSPIIENKLEALHEEISNISGAVAVFRGEQEGDVTAGNAIAELKGQAEMMFSKPVNNWNGLWKQTFYKLLCFAQKYLSLQDLVQIVGQSRQEAAQKFMACDIAKLLKINSSQSGIPQSRMEQRNEMIALFDQGALDINDFHVRERLFELFGETGMFQTFNADATRARLENKKMMDGQFVQVKPEIEDLAVHRSVHLDAIKSLGFDKLAPQVQQIMIEHFMETDMAFKASQLPLVPPGAPPAAPPQPPPSAKGKKTNAPPINNKPPSIPPAPAV